jgi:RNA polymerase sigma-70 factor (ECF subfamily)
MPWGRAARPDPASLAARRRRSPKAQVMRRFTGRVRARRSSSRQGIVDLMAELTHLAFDETYRRVFPMILSKCRRMIADATEAQDLAQEVFVRLWRAREEIAEPRALTAWLYRTCTRLAIDRARSRGRQDQVFTLAGAGGESGDGGEALAAGNPESLSASRRALADLAARTPARELEVVLLSRVDGLSHPEIAEVVGIGERTVRRLLTRFSERLAHIDLVEQGAS